VIIYRIDLGFIVSIAPTFSVWFWRFISKLYLDRIEFEVSLLATGEITILAPFKNYSLEVLLHILDSPHLAFELDVWLTIYCTPLQDQPRSKLILTINSGAQRGAPLLVLSVCVRFSRNFVYSSVIAHVNIKNFAWISGIFTDCMRLIGIVVFVHIGERLCEVRVI